MRFTVDTGGTFTDLVVEDDDGQVYQYKAPTVPADPVQGILDVFEVAAHDRGLQQAQLLAQGEFLIHGTTHALNALVQGRTSKTAFLTTKGHRDVLVLREGGKPDPFSHIESYPAPFVPRALTFDIEERIGADGSILIPLHEQDILNVIEAIRDADVEALAVCLLWSVINPVHERQISQLAQQLIPNIPVCLSSALNPIVREYRRASSTAINASLMPVMSDYLSALENRLQQAGFNGRVLMLTSQGGMVAVPEVKEKPILLLNSGPSLAPVAGRHYGELEAPGLDLIVADTGGTTYDVALVRQGEIPVSKEVWVGQPYVGHMVGFPSIDIRSIGAGGGSIARIDEGGVLHVGPESQGANPGPACYQLGGDEPTFTDACLVLGYLDASGFLGGKMQLDRDASVRVIQEKIADPLGVSLEDAAVGIFDVQTEQMVQSILDISLGQGMDPRETALIGGGGGAGLNSCFVFEKLKSRRLIFPELGATLSAAGAAMSNLTSTFRKAWFARTDRFDFQSHIETMDALLAEGARFAEQQGVAVEAVTSTFHLDARYINQAWELQIPIDGPIVDQASLENFQIRFDEFHRRNYGISDNTAVVEIVAVLVAVECNIRQHYFGKLSRLSQRLGHKKARKRRAYFRGMGWVEAMVADQNSLVVDQRHSGPAIIETSYTTIVVGPGTTFKLSSDCNLVVE